MVDVIVEVAVVEIVSLYFSLFVLVGYKYHNIMLLFILQVSYRTVYLLVF